MKFKSLLKIGLPLLGTTALAVSLPLALTSCSDSDAPFKLKTNLNSNYTISDLAEDFEDLKIEVNGDANNYGFQWYAKERVTNPASLTLSEEEDTTIAVPKELEGFKAIEGANKDVLTISHDKFASMKDKEYEVACVIYEKDNHDEYVVSNKTSLELANQVATDKSQITSFISKSKDLFGNNKDEFSKYIDTNGVVKKNSKTFNVFAEQLGFYKEGSNSSNPELDNRSEISEIKLVANSAIDTLDDSTKFDAQISLTSGNTWSLDLFNDEEPNFEINDANQLVLKGLEVKFSFETNARPTVGTVTITGNSSTNKGTPITLTAETSNDLSSLEEEYSVAYKWQSSDQENSGFQDISEATSKTYQVPATDVGTKYYKCIVTITGPSSYENTAESNGFAVKVNDVQEKPTITSINYDGSTGLTGAAGKVVIKAEITGEHLEGATYTWQFSNNGTNWSDYSGDGVKGEESGFQTLTFENATDANNGYYRVVIKDDSNVITDTSKSAQINKDNSSLVNFFSKFKR